MRRWDAKKAEDVKYKHDDPGTTHKGHCAHVHKSIICVTTLLVQSTHQQVSLQQSTKTQQVAGYKLKIKASGLFWCY